MSDPSWHTDAFPELLPGPPWVVQEMIAAQPALVEALLAGAGALQGVTLELAHARHTNPDLIRREQIPYREAAHQAESSPDW